MPSMLSFSVILATLTLSIVFSVIFPRKDKKESSEVDS
jgi:hypothetical protein